MHLRTNFVQKNKYALKWRSEWVRPFTAQAVQDDLQKNLRAAAQSAFARLDLVTREEFDVQRKLLARSRAKIELLEKQVAELEAKLLDKGKD